MWRPFGEYAGLSLLPSPNVIWRVSAACQVVHLDVVARSGSRGERDLVEGRRGPRRAIRVRLAGRDATQVRAVGADDVDLRRAGPIGRKGDLRAVRRPRWRRVDRRVVGNPADVRAVAVHHVHLGVAVAVRHESRSASHRAKRPAANSVRRLGRRLLQPLVNQRDEDVGVAATIRGVGDGARVRRPGRHDIQLPVRRHAPRVLAVVVGDVDLFDIAILDRPAIRSLLRSEENASLCARRRAARAAADGSRRTIVCA